MRPPWFEVIGATTPTLPNRSELYAQSSPEVFPTAVSSSRTTCSPPNPSGTPSVSANGAEITEPISSTHARIVPKTALITAATSEAPNVSL